MSSGRRASNATLRPNTTNARRATSRSPCTAAIAVNGSSHSRNCGESRGENTRKALIAAIGARPSSTPVPRGFARAARIHATATLATRARRRRPLTTLLTSPTRHAPTTMRGPTPPASGVVGGRTPAGAPPGGAAGARELPSLGATNRQPRPGAVDPPPRDPRRRAGGAGRDDRAGGPPRPPHDEHRDQHDGPEL